MVVEDNIYSACALISILDQYSLPYKLVLSGKQAVNTFMLRHTEESLTLPYKLIVMDYMLPGMNGLEASRQIIKFANQRNIEQPFIALLTSNPSQKIKNQAFDMQIGKVISKPIFKAGVQRLLIDAKLIEDRPI